MTKPSYKQWIAACTFTSTLLLGACGPAPVTRDASIVPLPNQIQQSGNAFVLTPNTTIGTRKCKNMLLHYKNMKVNPGIAAMKVHWLMES